MGLRDQVRGMIPEEILSHVPNRFETIGDIAVLDIPPPLHPFRATIADAIIRSRKNIRTILAKTGKVGGSSRTAAYEILVGATTITTCREYGFSYRLDVQTAFFSPRLATERKRVSDQVRPGERVFVPFAGVGPFAIPAAARGADVWAVERNPEAFAWLQENLTRNRVSDLCHATCGDALDISGMPAGGFDRLIIPAPYGMDHALAAILPLAGDGGRVHFYTFKAKEEIPGLVAGYEEHGLTVTRFGPCGNVAPGISRYVFDMVYSRRP